MDKTYTAKDGRAVDFELDEPNQYVYAELVKTESSYQICCVDGEIVGALIEAGSRTRPIPFCIGRHRLTVKTANCSGENVQWHIVSNPVESERDIVPGFEILTNAACPRSCPACNQSYWMRENPTYQYTVDDARRLVESLERNDRAYNLIFSGGEPKIWTHLDAVMDVFDACPKIRTTRITTSQYDRDWILHCRKRFDRVGISIRNDHPEYLATPPEWMDGCERWDARKHRIDVASCSEIRCGCVTVGVTAVIVGTDVYPCTLAADRGLRCREVYVPIPVEQYVSGEKCHRVKIGVMNACLACVNNTKTCGTVVNT